MRPARVLAPVALAAAAIALFAILASGGGDSETTASPAATTAPAKTTTAKPTRTPRSSGGTYTVKAGDTPSGIAEKLNIDVDALLAKNPGANPDALTVGDKLKLP